MAETAGRPVVLELFTSEGCSSCPPAEDLLGELARIKPDVLVLGFHVDYWNGPGWMDRFAFRGATTRQRDYAASLGKGVYTPQLVVDGRFQAVGSDRAAVLAAIASAQGAPVAGPALRIASDVGSVRVSVGPGSGQGSVVLAGFDNPRTTNVGGGENTGHLLTDVNPVRGLVQLGRWHGAAADFTAKRPDGDHVAVLVQSADGAIIAASIMK
jgi:hypothetical protein